MIRKACLVLVATGLALAPIGFATQDSQAITRRVLDSLPETLPTEVPLGLPPELAERRASDAVVALGRSLFFDPILSIDRSVACASCHDPKFGFADNRAKSPGVLGRETLRNAPTLFNRALGESFFWDGRAATLEVQVLMPIENELEMGLAVSEAVARLAADESYGARFTAAFDGPPSRERIAAALAGFVRRLLRGDRPIDRFRQGDHDALTAEQRGGLWFFESRGACWRCHVGANFTDESFHNTGVGALDGVPEDARFAVTGDEADRGAFKTPTLRGVIDTAPYMHDGSVPTLRAVVESYRDGGHANSHLDGLIRPLTMSERDVTNLVAFLESL